MLLELWLVVSTVCRVPCPTYVKQEKFCIQQVSISTFQPIPKEGETVYKVMPDGHVAIPKKVWDKTFRLAYWNYSPAQTYDEFEKLLDESEKVADKESRYYPHIHRWKDYQEIVNWTEKCYCGKKRRKVNVEKWVEE